VIYIFLNKKLITAVQLTTPAQQLRKKCAKIATP
jgi:hypothetical protein